VQSLAKSAELIMSSASDTLKNKKGASQKILLKSEGIEAKIEDASKEYGSQSTSTRCETLKKKPASHSVKKTIKKKKKTQKKKLDDADFQIDPRFGSNIKHNIKSNSKKEKVKHLADQKIKSVEHKSGPYIHVEGNWNLPAVVKIVNVHVKDDENEGKVKVLSKAAQYIDEEHRQKASKVGFKSTLSERYDSHNRDATWVCVFCKNYTHISCPPLGDLFGPYYIQVKSAAESVTTNETLGKLV